MHRFVGHRQGKNRFWGDGNVGRRRARRRRAAHRSRRRDRAARGRIPTGDNLRRSRRRVQSRSRPFPSPRLLARPHPPRPPVIPPASSTNPFSTNTYSTNSCARKRRSAPKTRTTVGRLFGGSVIGLRARRRRSRRGRRRSRRRGLRCGTRRGREGWRGSPHGARGRRDRPRPSGRAAAARRATPFNATAVARIGVFAWTELRASSDAGLPTRRGVAATGKSRSAPRISMRQARGASAAHTDAGIGAPSCRAARWSTVPTGSCISHAVVRCTTSSHSDGSDLRGGAGDVGDPAEPISAFVGGVQAEMDRECRRGRAWRPRCRRW